MKGRTIALKFWSDPYIFELPAKQKLLFNYFITNEHISMSGIYEIHDKYILFETDLTASDLEEAKLRFDKDKKFSFYEGWCFVHNNHKHNSFSWSQHVVDAFVGSFNKIPRSVRSYFFKERAFSYTFPFKSNLLGFKKRESDTDYEYDIDYDYDWKVGGRLGKYQNDTDSYGKEHVDPDSVPDFGLPKTLKSRVASGFALLAIALLFSTTPVSAIKIDKQYQITSKYVTQHPVQLKTPVKTQQIASPTRLKGETPKQGSVLPVTSTVRNQQHPAPVYAPLPEFKKEVARKIKLAFPDDAREMIAIAMAESGLRCEAINHMDSNGVQSVGLFQINDGRLFDDNDIANLTNCDHNMTRAKQKYATQTKRAWGAFTNGAYQRYLWIFDEI